MQLLRLLRVHQYIKNLLIFFPLFFALKFTDWYLLLKTFGAFVAFSLVASTIYIINDIKDLPEDREHPDKKQRPIASGAISISRARIIAAISAVSGFALGFYLNPILGAILIMYACMNTAYSFYLKHVALLDIFVIAFGFMLRLIAGTQYAGIDAVEPSHWIIIMTFLLSLFLAFAKRRDDVLLAKEGKKTRKAASGYTLEFINSALSIMAAVLIVSYILYTISPAVTTHFGSQNIYLTVVCVIMGLFRYMQLIYVFNKSGQPTELLLKDRFLQLCIIAWIAVFAVIAY